MKTTDVGRIPSEGAPLYVEKDIQVKGDGSLNSLRLFLDLKKTNKPTNKQKHCKDSVKSSKSYANLQVV